jgi:hypothetical protein
MRRDEAGDRLAFMALAEARSFTRAAAKLGTSQSAHERPLTTALRLRSSARV